jgi:hypothetical protein
MGNHVGEVPVHDGHGEAIGGDAVALEVGLEEQRGDRRRHVVGGVDELLEPAHAQGDVGLRLDAGLVELGGGGRSATVRAACCLLLHLLLHLLHFYSFLSVPRAVIVLLNSRC